jgi:hypothetical protein
MIRSIKNVVWSILRAIGLGGSFQLALGSALTKYGWFRSYHSGRSEDAEGKPLPWYTYSFTLFLEPRVKKSFHVFEYGSGNSTRWYAARVEKITAVEHDKAWIKIVNTLIPANARVIEADLGDDYIESVGQENKYYDIIVVDGRKRVKCTAFAIDYLSPDGVLILDNSERGWYQEAKDFMKKRGFRQLDFQGMLPIVGHESCTTVFYRDGNCLGI